MHFIYQFFFQLDEIFWGYVAFAVILSLGGYLTLKNRLFQIKCIPKAMQFFFQSCKKKEKEARGVHPLKVFFASAGGMIGIGNIVGIATAVQLGGPGALFWVWVASIIGAIVKYCEIYLGFKYRVANKEGGWDGGPMYFLRKAFKNRWIPSFIAVLLCIYGVEIYTFKVVSDSVALNWHLSPLLVTVFLLSLVLYAGMGGIKRVGKICAAVMPVFIFVYLGLALWVFAHKLSLLPSLCMEIMQSAFSGHAAVGGFAGCSMLVTIQQGISRAAYSSDIGVGNDAIIQSESSLQHPEKQGLLSIFGIFIDTIICTLSILLILVSGVWKSGGVVAGSHLVQNALSQYFVGMKFFMPVFLFIVGYTTIISYFCVGVKCARYLSSRWGKKAYFVYALCSLLFFSFFNQNTALLVMSLSGAILLIINVIGIFRLRREIDFYSLTEPEILSQEG